MSPRSSHEGVMKRVPELSSRIAMPADTLNRRPAILHAVTIHQDMVYVDRMKLVAYWYSSNDCHRN